MNVPSGRFAEIASANLGLLHSNRRNRDARIAEVLDSSGAETSSLVRGQAFLQQ
jgi:hypothetical protein